MTTRSLLLFSLATFAVGCVDFDPLSDGILNADAGSVSPAKDDASTPAASAPEQEDAASGGGPVGTPVKAEDASACPGDTNDCDAHDASVPKSAADTGPPIGTSVDSGATLNSSDDAGAPADVVSPPDWIVMTNNANACDGYLGVACGWSATNEGQGYSCQTTTWGTGCEPPGDAAAACGAPNGSYAQSCSNCGLSDGLLTCDCLDTSGNSVTSSLDLCSCAQPPNVSNQDGVLGC